MPTDELFWRKTLVLVSGVVYWTGVFVQARRVGRHIGRSPNVRPRGAKETWLWLGWLVVVAVWLGQPVVASGDALPTAIRPISLFVNRPGLWLGAVLVVTGYAGTLWCYGIMGDAWRIGINRVESNVLVTAGPFRLVRHPIYLCQIIILGGTALLLPTALSLMALLVHLGCVEIKAVDEEAYLLSVHGEIYRDYIARTGRLLPKWT